MEAETSESDFLRVLKLPPAKAGGSLMIDPYDFNKIQRPPMPVYIKTVNC